jgi:hypothetical protein
VLDKRKVLVGFVALAHQIGESAMTYPPGTSHLTGIPRSPYVLAFLCRVSLGQDV